MPAISLGLDEVEERLRQIRSRLNSLSLQHVVYSSGSLIVVLGALLIVIRLRASPAIINASTTAYAVIVCFIIGLAIIRLRSRWLSLENVARRADRKAALDSRLATLYAQRARPQRSRLGGILLAQTIALGPRWDRSALAPRRIPRSAYFLLASLALLGAASLVPPKQVDPAIPEGTSAAEAPNDEPDISGVFNEESADNSISGMVASTGPNEMTEPSGTGREQDGYAPGAAGESGSPSNDSPDDATAGAKGARGLAGASKAPETGIQDFNMRRNESNSGLRSAELQRPGQQGDAPDKRASEQTATRSEQNATSPERRAKRDRAQNPSDGDPLVHPQDQSGPLDNSATKGGAKPSGKSGTVMNDPLFTAGEQQSTQEGTTGAPGTFALRLTGVSTSALTTLEPQKQPQQDTRGAFGLGHAATEPAPTEDQVEDEPLQRDLIAPEHESLVQRIFRHQ